MLMGGVPVEDRLILQLSLALPPALAHKLKTAYVLKASVLGLTTDERQTILAALEKPPTELQTLRDTLLQDPAWRLRERLQADLRPVGQEKLKRESGQTMAEYALLLGGLAIVCIVAVVFLGGRIGDLFGGTGASLQHGPFIPPSPKKSPLLYPATIEDCQDGGWRNFPQFANEAECKEYVRSTNP